MKEASSALSPTLHRTVALSLWGGTGGSTVCGDWSRFYPHPIPKAALIPPFSLAICTGWSQPSTLLRRLTVSFFSFAWCSIAKYWSQVCAEVTFPFLSRDGCLVRAKQTEKKITMESRVKKDPTKVSLGRRCRTRETLLRGASSPTWCPLSYTSPRDIKVSSGLVWDNEIFVSKIHNKMKYRGWVR